MIELGGLLVAWLRAMPFALGLPLPGLLARIAFGAVLGLVGVGAVKSEGAAPLVEIVVGVGLGLGLAWPLWAARWAGAVVDGPSGKTRAMATLYVTLAWTVFLAIGGGRLLCSAYAASYARWPVGATPRLGLESLASAGAAFGSLAARLALPSLLAIAVAELGAGLVARLEGAAVLPAGAPSLARGLRPILVVLLLVGSLAAFAQGIGVAMASR